MKCVYISLLVPSLAKVGLEGNLDLYPTFARLTRGRYVHVVTVGDLVAVVTMVGVVDMLRCKLHVLEIASSAQSASSQLRNRKRFLDSPFSLR